MRSKASQLELECEEEELEPWQKQTSHVQLKVKDEVEELSTSHQTLEESGGNKLNKHLTRSPLKSKRTY